MALRFGGLFIEAIVENGAGTFAIGSNNAFANSLNSISLRISSGGSSEIQLGLAPTFGQAVDIIESGFLGYGFPVQKSGGGSVLANVVNGLMSNPTAQSLASAFGVGTGDSEADTATPSTKAASVAVRLGYGDPGAREDVAMTPWFNGIISAPDLSFGEEIQITLKAVSFGAKLASSDTTRNFEDETLYAVVNQIVDEDIKGTVRFEGQAEQRAQSIRVKKNQTDNSQAFLRQLLSDYNFQFHESGGDAKNPKQELVITDLGGVFNQKPKFTLVMYGQIDVPNKVYPIESFDTKIDHTFVAGAFFGQKVTNLRTGDKEVKKKKLGLKEFKKDVKSSGDTISGQHQTGKPTKGGATDGPPSLSDRSKAGLRKLTVTRNENDKEQNEAVKSQTNDAIAGALSVTVTCPLIPEALPNTLVRLKIFTGNKNNPVFNTVSGVYRVIEVTHNVSDAGGSTEFNLLRAMGSASVESEGIQKVADTVLSTDSTAQESIVSVIRGIIS